MAKKPVKKKLVKKKLVKKKLKIYKYKCDKCDREFSARVSKLKIYPACTNPDCKSTCTQRIE